MVGRCNKSTAAATWAEMTVGGLEMGWLLRGGMLMWVTLCKQLRCSHLLVAHD